MKKIVTVLCVAALMACMTGCGCGTMVDDGGTSVESTTRRETSTEHYNETSHNGTTEHYNETSHNGTTEHYYDETTHNRTTEHIMKLLIMEQPNTMILQHIVMVY